MYVQRTNKTVNRVLARKSPLKTNTLNFKFFSIIMYHMSAFQFLGLLHGFLKTIFIRQYSILINVVTQDHNHNCEMQIHTIRYTIHLNVSN